MGGVKKNRQLEFIAEIIYLITVLIYAVSKVAFIISGIGVILGFLAEPYILIKMFLSNKMAYKVISIIIVFVSLVLVIAFFIILKYFEEMSYSHGIEYYITRIILTIVLTISGMGMIILGLLPSIILLIPLDKLSKKSGLACIKVSDKYLVKIKNMLGLSDEEISKYMKKTDN